MKTATVAAVKAQLAAYLKETEQGPIIVTRNGKPVAALVAVADDDDVERLALAHSPKFRAILEKSRRSIEETGAIPHDRFWREVEAATRQAGNESRKRPSKIKAKRRK